MITGFVFLLVGLVAIGWAHLRGRKKARRAVVITSAKQLERWHDFHTSWLKVKGEDDYPGATEHADSNLTWEAERASCIRPIGKLIK